MAVIGLCPFGWPFIGLNPVKVGSFCTQKPFAAKISRHIGDRRYLVLEVPHDPSVPGFGAPLNLDAELELVFEENTVPLKLSVVEVAYGSAYSDYYILYELPKNSVLKEIHSKITSNTDKPFVCGELAIRHGLREGTEKGYIIAILQFIGMSFIVVGALLIFAGWRKSRKQSLVGEARVMNRRANQ